MGASPDEKPSDAKLFEHTLHLRRALRAAVKAQEKQCRFPEAATVIKIKFGEGKEEKVRQERFNNQMTLCIDGEEVIICGSDLTNINSRENFVKSQLGEDKVNEFRQTLETIFMKAGMGVTEYAALKKLEELIVQSKDRPTPRTTDERLKVIEDGIKSMQQRLDSK